MGQAELVDRTESCPFTTNGERVDVSNTDEASIVITTTNDPEKYSVSIEFDDTTVTAIVEKEFFEGLQNTFFT